MTEAGIGQTCSTHEQLEPAKGNHIMSSTDRPFGWRKRIGILSPTVIETTAYDFYRLGLDGISMCAITPNIER